MTASWRMVMATPGWAPPPCFSTWPSAWAASASCKSGQTGCRLAALPWLPGWAGSAEPGPGQLLDYCRARAPELLPSLRSGPAGFRFGLAAGEQQPGLRDPASVGSQEVAKDDEARPEPRG